MRIVLDKDSKDEKLSRIDAQILIPGRGQPLDHASLIFSGKKIVFVGKTDRLDSKYKTLQAIRVPVLMPGLWDSHLHFNGATMYGADVMASTHQAVAGARLARDVVALLNAGFTSVRELAGYGVQMAQVIEEGWLPGPNIYSAVSVLSMTAGHGDPRNIPLHVFEDQIAHNLPSCLCDGPSECTKAVRVQIRNGAKVIKVAASDYTLPLLLIPAFFHIWVTQWKFFSERFPFLSTDENKY